MIRSIALGLAYLLLAGGSASPIAAQDWRPPSSEMPAMPQASELSGAWINTRSDWFGGAATVAGVSLSTLQVVGEGRTARARAQFVRVSSGPLPVMVWQDRNGDGRADLIEIFRSGGVIFQLIDADYDGTANVLRVYDAAGTLIRENRL